MAFLHAILLDKGRADVSSRLLHLGVVASLLRVGIGVPGELVEWLSQYCGVFFILKEPFPDGEIPRD